MKNLQQLIGDLNEQLGISGHELSEDELTKLVRAYKAIPEAERTNLKVQKILDAITGTDHLIIREAIDNSDIDNVIDQIEIVLKKKK